MENWMEEEGRAIKSLIKQKFMHLQDFEVDFKLIISLSAKQNYIILEMKVNNFLVGRIYLPLLSLVISSIFLFQLITINLIKRYIFKNFQFSILFFYNQFDNNNEIILKTKIYLKFSYFKEFPNNSIKLIFDLIKLILIN